LLRCSDGRSSATISSQRLRCEPVHLNVIQDTPGPPPCEPIPRRLRPLLLGRSAPPPERPQIAPVRARNAGKYAKTSLKAL